MRGFWRQVIIVTSLAALVFSCAVLEAPPPAGPTEPAESAQPAQPGPRVDPGWGALAEGRYPEAEQAFRQAVGRARQQSPRSDETVLLLYGLALSLFLQNQTDASEQTLAEAIALGDRLVLHQHPEFCFMLDRHGARWIEAGRFAEAEKALALSLELKRSCPELGELSLAYTQNALGTLYYHLRRLESAEKALKESLRIKTRKLATPNASIAVTMNNLGMVRFARGDAKDALYYLKDAYLQRRQVLGPNHQDAIATAVNLGNVYFNLGDLPLAEQYFRIALAGGDSSPDAALNLGALYCKKADATADPASARKCLDAAEVCFKDACAKQPDAKAYAELGGLMAELSSRENSDAQKRAMRGQAIQYLSKSVQLEPASVVNLVRLARLHAKNGDHRLALPLVEKAITLAPAEPRLRFYQGWLLEQIGASAEASLAYRKCRELDPNEPLCGADPDAVVARDGEIIADGAAKKNAAAKKSPAKKTTKKSSNSKKSKSKSGSKPKTKRPR